MAWWRQKKVWLIITLIVVAVLVLIFGVANKKLASSINKSQPSEAAVDEQSLPKFIQADWIDLQYVASISKFRSAMGRGYPDKHEECRSMKHYFNLIYDRKNFPYSPGGPLVPPPDPGTGIAIYSPVDGTITKIEGEGDFGDQIFLRPQSHRQFTLRLFHIYPRPGLTSGMTVKAGEKIGEIRRDQNTDIAVELKSFTSVRFISFFEVMPDSVFVAYETRGITSPDQLIISKEARDAKPLECQGDRFVKNYQSDPAYADEVVNLQENSVQ